MTNQPVTTIRRECLQRAIYWARPTGAEIQEVVQLAGFTGRTAACYDLADESGRQIRRWDQRRSGYPYSARALLCHAAIASTYRAAVCGAPAARDPRFDRVQLVAHRETPRFADAREPTVSPMETQKSPLR
ncbi:MAG: hypothetical protein ACTHL0_12690 [Trinickia sp.]